jgi:hypothetical protein
VYARFCELRLLPPTPERIERLIHSACATAEQQSFAETFARLSDTFCTRLDVLLTSSLQAEGREEDTEEDEETVPLDQVTWYDLKLNPGPVGVKSVRQELAKLRTLEHLKLPEDLFDTVPTKVLCDGQRSDRGNCGTGAQHPGPRSTVLKISADAGGYLLQEPGVAIGVAEMDILDASQVVNLADCNTTACQFFARLVDIRYDQVQPLDRPGQHLGNLAQTGSDHNRAGRAGRCKLDNSHSVPRRPYIKVQAKSNLFHVKCSGAINISNRYRYQLKFHLYHALSSFYRLFVAFSRISERRS